MGATIMSATRRSWEVEVLSTAIHTSFLGLSTRRWSHGAFGVDELKDRVEDLNPKIEAIVGSLKPQEEGDAAEVLATWKQA